MTAATVMRSVVGALGILVIFASPSYADHVLYHGSLCNPERGSVNLVEYNQFGVHNAATPIAFVDCGGAIEDSSTIQVVEVIIYDRNSTADVSCTLMLVDKFGNIQFSAAQSTPNPQDTGPQTLTLAPTAPIPSATINLRCSIPPPDAAGVSHVTTYGSYDALTRRCLLSEGVSVRKQGLSLVPLQKFGRVA